MGQTIASSKTGREYRVGEVGLLTPSHHPCPAGMVGLAFFVTGLGWSGLALFLYNRAGLERAGPGWQLLTKTGLQGFSLA